MLVTGQATVTALARNVISHSSAQREQSHFKSKTSISTVMRVDHSTSQCPQSTRVREGSFICALMSSVPLTENGHAIPTHLIPAPPFLCNHPRVHHLDLSSSSPSPTLLVIPTLPAPPLPIPQHCPATAHLTILFSTDLVGSLSSVLLHCSPNFLFPSSPSACTSERTAAMPSSSFPFFQCVRLLLGLSVVLTGFIPSCVGWMSDEVNFNGQLQGMVEDGVSSVSSFSFSLLSTESDLPLIPIPVTPTLTVATMMGFCRGFALPGSIRYCVHPGEALDVQVDLRPTVPHSLPNLDFPMRANAEMEEVEMEVLVLDEPLPSSSSLTLEPSSLLPVPAPFHVSALPPSSSVPPSSLLHLRGLLGVSSVELGVFNLGLSLRSPHLRLDSPLTLSVEVTCSDGIFCNGAERWVGGVNGSCVAGVDPCDDRDICTTDTCDETFGTSETTLHHHLRLISTFQCIDRALVVEGFLLPPLQPLQTSPHCCLFSLSSCVGAVVSIV